MRIARQQSLGPGSPTRARSVTSQKSSKCGIQRLTAKPSCRLQTVGINVAKLQTKTDIAGALREAASGNDGDDTGRVAWARVAPVTAARKRTQHAVGGANTDAIDSVFTLSPVAVVARLAGGACRSTRGRKVGAKSSSSVTQASWRAVFVAAAERLAKALLACTVEGTGPGCGGRHAHEVRTIQTFGFARLGVER
jgi:hypothetical protein